MSIATVTSKGQVTIPQDVRERLHIVSGTRVEFAERADGVVEFIPLTGSVMDLAGIITWSGPPVSIEEMDDAIGEYLAEEDRRSRE
ncbi:MAG TPA: AbrB/MazE/SpoVT family DNA-binding domain-containing protein [Pseudolysinimonas sp.]